MKRSEMVEEIVKYINQFDGGYLKPYAADKLLEHIESIGMLPPPYFDSFYYDEPECDGWIPEWEPENEKDE